MSKVKLISKVNERVYIEGLDGRIKHHFMGKNSVYAVEKEDLEQLLYEPGIDYMIRSGMLYIEDMDVKKELGLEPEDATEPVNIIVLDDTQRRRYMTVMPLHDFKEAIEKLSYEQLQQLADFAIANRLADLEKCKIIKKICGRDIIRAIQLHDADTEEE